VTSPPARGTCRIRPTVNGQYPTHGIDDVANDTVAGVLVAGPVAVLVVVAREDVVIARESRALTAI